MASNPTPHYDGEADEEQEAMMAKMGFASFGSKGKGPKAKKVKLRRDGEVERGTGGNLMPLGKVRGIGRGGGEGGGGMGKVMGTGIIGGVAPAAVGGGGRETEKVEAGEEEGGVRLPMPPPIVRMGNGDGDPRYEDDGGDEDQDMSVKQWASSMANALPLKPQPQTYPVTGPPGVGGAGNSRCQRRMDGKNDDGSWDWYALRKGVRDENGNMAFYDASFVEDPWRALKGERA